MLLLCRSQNQVHSTLSLDNPAHLTGLESKGRILEWLLHLTSSERAKVPSFGM